MLVTGLVISGFLSVNESGVDSVFSILENRMAENKGTDIPIYISVAPKGQSNTTTEEL